MFQYNTYTENNNLRKMLPDSKPQKKQVVQKEMKCTVQDPQNSPKIATGRKSYGKTCNNPMARQVI